MVPAPLLHGDDLPALHSTWHCVVFRTAHICRYVSCKGAMWIWGQRQRLLLSRGLVLCLQSCVSLPVCYRTNICFLVYFVDKWDCGCAELGIMCCFSCIAWQAVSCQVAGGIGLGGTRDTGGCGSGVVHIDQHGP